MKGTRLGFRKRNLLVYRNLLRVKFLDLKKSSKRFYHIFEERTFRFKKEKKPNSIS